MATAIENTGPAEFVHPTTGHPKPPAGLSVNGCTLLEFTGKFPAGSGSYAYGVGIFHNPQNTYHPYVVWTLILQPCPSGHRDCTVDCGWCKGTGAKWIVEQGDYCETLPQAIEHYEWRGGK